METPFDSLLALSAGRRSRRTFQDRPLDPDLIERIQSVARTSPYASGKKNWEVMVVVDRALRESMARLVERRVQEIRERIRPDMAEDFADYAKHFTGFVAAPALFVPTFRVAPSLSLLCPEPDERIVRWERDNFVKSISCAGMLILLAAESLGLAACYMTGPLIAEEALGKLIGVKPGRSIGAVIPVGYRTDED